MVRKTVLDRGVLEERLKSLPRMRLAHLPTPLEECPNLSRELGGPRILIKRDDCTGLAFGGNKARHYEYLFADIKAKGYDAYINIMDWRSNNARLTAAACNRAGLRYILVLRGGKGRPFQGNMLVDHLLGAEMHLLGDVTGQEANQYARGLADTLRAEGWKPYLITEQDFTLYAGVVAYAQAALELKDQLDALGVGAVRIFGVAGRSTSGLALTAKNLGFPWHVTGITVSDEVDYQQYIFGKIDEAARMLGFPSSLDQKDMEVLGQYVGPGYGVPSRECIEAIRLVARTESIILDPNYTGKAMAGMIDQIRQGNVGRNETVVFLHTGGLPALFWYAEELTAQG